MTTRDRFDDVVAQWLVESGPADIRAAAVEQAIGIAAQRPQHRGLRARLGDRPWQASRGRTALVIAVAVLALVAITVVVGMFLLRQPPTPGSGWISVSSSVSAIHVLSPDGATDRSFSRFHSSCPKLSPDGADVGYAIRFKGFHVTRLADESHRQVGSSSTFGYREGVWSPDRAYRSFRSIDGAAQVLNVAAVFDAVDPAPRALLSTTTEDIVSEAAWSADSTRVAVAHGRDGQFTISILDLGGVATASIGPFSIGPDAAQSMLSAWSPDGNRLAYTDLVDGALVVQVIDLARGTRSTVASGFGDFPAASPWSRDGRWLAVTGTDGRLVIVSADGQNRVTGPAVAADVEQASAAIKWSPVDDVVAIRTSTGLSTVRPDGTNRIDVQAMTGSNQWDFAWSPDGARIVVAEDRGSAGLVVTNVDATGQSAPIHVATYQTQDNAPYALCLSWDGPTAGR